MANILDFQINSGANAVSVSAAPDPEQQAAVNSSPQHVTTNTSDGVKSLLIAVFMFFALLYGLKLIARVVNKRAK